MVLQGAMAVPVARSVLNRRTGFRQMWTLSRSKLGALLGLGGLLLLAVIGAGAVLVGGAVLLANTMGGSSALIIVPLFLGVMVTTVWIAIRLIVAPAAVVVEELGALEGLRRSWQLTRNNWWRIFGISLVVSLLIGIIGQILLIPISLATGGLAAVVSPHGGDGQAQSLTIWVLIAATIISGLVAAAGYAFQTSVVSLLYMDLRMRKEGLDLSLLRLLESGADDDGVPGRGLAPARDTGNARAGGLPPAPYGTPPGPG
jgi:Membrane domain of glycerophosphoryl diester phosphodiesterase